MQARALCLFIGIIIPNLLFLGCQQKTNRERILHDETYINAAEKYDTDTVGLKGFLQPLLTESNSDDLGKVIYNVLMGKATYLSMEKENGISDQYFNKALQIAKNQDAEAYILWVNISIARYYYQFRKLEKSLPYFLKASFLIDEIDPTEQLKPAETYQYLSYVFITLDEKDKSMYFLKKALELTPDSCDLKSVLLDNMGFNLLVIRDTIAAIKSFKMAENSALIQDNLTRLARIKGNFANIYHNRGDLQKALDFVNEDIKYSLIVKDSVNLAYARLLKTKILIKQNLTEGALKELDLVDDCIKNVPYLLGYRLEIEELKVEIAHKMGNKDAELLSRRNLYKIEHEGNYGENNRAMVRAKLLLNKEIYLNEMKLADLRIEKARFSNIINLILAMLICIVIIFRYFYMRKVAKARSEKYERKVLEFQLEKTLLDQKLSDARTTVRDYLKYMTEKNAQIEELQEVISNINQSRSAHLEEKNGKLKQVLKSHLLTEENWIKFKQAFDKQYPKYYLNIRRQYPDLTENNLKFILLQKLGLSAFETSNILGVSLEAVKKNKQRLKKRMGDDYDMLMELI